MFSAPRPYKRAVTVLAAAVSLVLLLAMLSSRSTPARAASIGQLQQQISAGQGVISGLAGAVSAANGQVGHLNGSISTLAGQISRLQADLDAKRRELLQLRSQLDATRRRLARLEAFDARAEALLANQLVHSYESDTPDLVTVVLDATGFQDLLEKLSFQQRIRKQNVAVIEQVKAARRAVSAEATRLGALELRQQKLTQDVLMQRQRLDQTKVGLVQQELAAARSRDAKAGKLADARGHVGSLKRQLAHLLAVQAAEALAAARAQTQAAAQDSPPAAAVNSSSGSSAPISPSQVSSAGGFTFPLPKGSVVGPGSWSLDDGVDMSAPGGTPEFAVCSGTIVLHGIGGFGPWAPVLHCDSPVGGYSYVYYGHAGPANQLAVGTHVSAGQVISEVGPGIVGISTGPHIEIGFCDSSGGPIGPSSAGAMMSLLQSSY